MSTEQSPAGTAPQGRRTIPLTEITLPHQCPRPVRLYVLSRAPYFRGLGEAELDLGDHFRSVHPTTNGIVAIEHGEKIGLGSKEYELIKI